MNKKRLKKIAVFGLFGTFWLSAGAANPVINNPDNHGFFGLRAAFDLSVPQNFKYNTDNNSSSTKVFTSAPGASIGLTYNAPVVANLYVEPGLEFYYNTTGIDIMTTYLDSDEIQISPDAMFSNKSTRQFGIRIPVTIGYHFDFIRDGNLSVFAGPVLNVGLSNDYYITTKEILGESFHISGSLYNGLFGDRSVKLQRIGLGLRTGVGFHFCRNFYLGLSGDIGLLNMIKIPDRNKEQLKISYHQNTFMLSLGYCFR